MELEIKEADKFIFKPINFIGGNLIMARSLELTWNNNL